jgi:beta-glucanase (GH16 family)
MKNIEISNDSLSILAKKEKTDGKVWNPTLGLMPKQFDYSSTILNSASSFRMREGVVEAKVRFKKDASITSAFSLTSEKPFPQIDLFRSTKKGVGMGILEKQGDGSSKYVKLSGLNDERHHIFRLESFNDQLVWKINGTEVFRTSTFLKEPLFFHLLTSLHGEVNEHILPHRFEVHWIRCYSKKS